MIYPILFLLGIYVVSGTVLFLSLVLIPGRKKQSGLYKSVSVIVPFRNEASQLPGLVRSLLAQDYPQELLEIILIDDHSGDNSFLVANKLTKGQTRFTVLKNHGSPGKKQALLAGVKAAGNSWILTTDADCTHEKGWVSAMTRLIVEGKTRFISGPVHFNAPVTFTGVFQVLESAAMQSVSAALFLLRVPAICNAANMGFRKDLYLKAYPGIHPDIRSGDDVFLLHKAKRMGKQSVEFSTSFQSVVTTRAKEGLYAGLNQRIRWGAKATLYRDLSAIILSLIVFTGNLSVLPGSLYLMGNPGLGEWMVALLAGKFFIDFLLIFMHLQKSNQWKYLPFYPVVAAIYPLYITFTGIYALFKDPGR